MKRFMFMDSVILEKIQQERDSMTEEQRADLDAVSDAEAARKYELYMSKGSKAMARIAGETVEISVPDPTKSAFHTATRLKNPETLTTYILKPGVNNADRNR